MRNKKRLWAAGLLILVLAAGGFWRYSTVAAAEKQENAIKNQIFITDAQKQAAPSFTLTDQNGKAVTLADLKGKVVILQFMDPECTDVCPLVSQELVDANQLLGDKSKDVVYVAVNVNEYHAAQADVLDFSKQHGLNNLNNWHFVTGSADQLKAVWKAYGIEVTPSKDGDVQHSTDMYFIDQNGEERYVGYPDNEPASLSDWSKGIAFFAKNLL